MNKEELDKLCARPGNEGVLWRLVRAWDPDNLGSWLRIERRFGMQPEVAVNNVAEVMSGAAMVLANEMKGDRQGAIFGDQGLFPKLTTLTKHKLTQVGGAHIILPSGGKG